MASTKISGLTTLAGSGVAQTTDMVPIVDTSATETKSILISELSLAQNKNGTEQATTSGTEFDFTIPSWATRISVMLRGVSQNATPRNMQVQIGDSDGVEETDYYGAQLDSGGTVYPYSTGYRVGVLSASNVMEGTCEITLQNRGNNTWICKHSLATSEGANGLQRGVGRKSLSGTLTTVRLMTDGTFDAGVVNVLYS